METILAWLTAHPFVMGVATGIAISVGLWLLWVLWMLVEVLWLRWRDADRSGAKLVPAGLNVTHDQANDEAVFTWTLGNAGKHQARDLRCFITIRSELKDRTVVIWRVSRAYEVLTAGAQTDVIVRISRAELARLAHDFKDGWVLVWTQHSASAPGRKPKPFTVEGPRLRYALAVGQLGGADCVTVTDFTPMER